MREEKEGAKQVNGPSGPEGRTRGCAHSSGAKEAVMTKWEFLQTELATLEREGLLSHPRTVESAQGAWILVEGTRVLNLCANNYLGFANHPRLKAAAQAAIERFGVGPAAVRSIVGTLSLHRELEQKLAAFKGVEATLSLQSGFNANLAVIPALVQDGDVICSDALNHASIIDGCRLSRAQVVRYRHCDPDSLAAALRQTAGARRRLVITDGVCSMDGEMAPLPEIVQAAAPYNALVMVDDAHGEGVLGQGGRGITEHFGLQGQVDIAIGTLSKAFGVVGGYVAGPRVLIDYLQQRGRPFLFASATTAADVAACMAAGRHLAALGAGGAAVMGAYALFPGRAAHVGLRSGAHPDAHYAAHGRRCTAGQDV